MPSYLCHAIGHPMGQGEEWEVICHDFGLVSRGDSRSDAFRQIAEAISLYLEYVESLPEEERDAFLTRRTPWRSRLMWTFSGILRWPAGRSARALVNAPIPVADTR